MSREHFEADFRKWLQTATLTQLITIVSALQAELLGRGLPGIRGLIDAQEALDRYRTIQEQTERLKKL